MKVLLQKLFITVTPISGSVKSQNALAVLSVNAKFSGHFRRSIMAWTASTWSQRKNSQLEV